MGKNLDRNGIFIRHLDNKNSVRDITDIHHDVFKNKMVAARYLRLATRANYSGEVIIITKSSDVYSTTKDLIRNGFVFDSYKINNRGTARSIDTTFNRYEDEWMGLSIEDTTNRVLEPKARYDEIIDKLRNTDIDIKKAMPHLIELGKSVLMEGHTQSADFARKMKEYLGDLWQDFRKYVYKVYTEAKAALNNQRGSVGGKNNDRDDRGRSTGKDKGDNRGRTERNGSNGVTDVWGGIREKFESNIPDPRRIFEEIAILDKNLSLAFSNYVANNKAKISYRMGSKDEFAGDRHSQLARYSPNTRSVSFNPAHFGTDLAEAILHETIHNIHHNNLISPELFSEIKKEWLKQGQDVLQHLDSDTKNFFDKVKITPKGRKAMLNLVQNNEPTITKAVFDAAKKAGYGDNVYTYIDLVALYASAKANMDSANFKLFDKYFELEGIAYYAAANPKAAQRIFEQANNLLNNQAEGKSRSDFASDDGTKYSQAAADSEIEQALNIRFVPDKSLKGEERAIAELGAHMGVPVRFFVAKRGDRGFHADGITYVNRNGDRGIEWAFWHESLHWLKQQVPELYQDLYDAVNDTFSATPEQIAAYRDTIAQGQLRGENGDYLLSDDAIIEEMFGDEMGDVAKRQKWLNQLAQQDKGLFDRFVDFLKEMLANIKAMVARDGVGQYSGFNPKQVKEVEKSLRNVLLSLKDATGQRVVQDRTAFPYRELQAEPMFSSGNKESHVSGSKPVDDFIVESIKKKNMHQDMMLRSVSENEAQRIKDKTGYDVRGYSHYLSSDDLRHILNQHGAESEKQDNQIPLTIEDLKRIPEILDNPQQITKGNPTKREGLPTVRFIRPDDSGTYVVVEAIRKQGKKMVVKTMWKKSVARHRASNADPLHTSTSAVNAIPPGGNQTSSVNSIVQQDGKDVNDKAGSSYAGEGNNIKYSQSANAQQKPISASNNNSEIRINPVMRQGQKTFTQQGRKMIQTLESRGWEKTDNPDGSVVFKRPAKNDSTQGRKNDKQQTNVERDKYNVEFENDATEKAWRDSKTIPRDPLVERIKEGVRSAWAHVSREFVHTQSQGDGGCVNSRTQPPSPWLYRLCRLIHLTICETKNR